MTPHVVTLGTAGGPRWWNGPDGAPRSGISTAVVVGDAVYLVDCGQGTGRQLAAAGLRLGQVRALFLTHLHSDHVVDLPSLLLFGQFERKDPALAPIADAIEPASVVVDAKSGVSGAGREPKAEMHFSEVNESVRPYGVGGHRHVAEIEQELAFAGGAQANPGARAVAFLPHIIPMTRGILASCHVRSTRPVSQSELDALYAQAYAGEPFVQVVGSPPATKHVLGSNNFHVHVRADERTGRVLALGVLDNLVKGAAGQAVQAFNVLFGLPEQLGLEQLPLNP
jgi:hypothetical protein